MAYPKSKKKTMKYKKFPCIDTKIKNNPFPFYGEGKFIKNIHPLIEMMQKQLSFSKVFI
jgi:hypothetical protein